MKAVPAVPHCAALVLAIAATLALTGCAGVGQPEGLTTLGAASTSATDPVAELTGSRIPARRTEKMVSQIGSRDYKEYRDAMPAPLTSH